MAKPLPTTRAAGFVMTRETAGGEPEYLLLTSVRDGMPGLPKGHTDGHEEDLATARRETLEETGLSDLAVDPWFRREISYRVKKDGEARWKTVVYFRARVGAGDVRLSREHTGFRWVPLAAALDAITFDSLRDVVWRAALHAKDPALFRLRPPDFAAAERHLTALPHADAPLVEHLRGGARLARAFAEALSRAGKRLDVEAAAVGTLLHDTGRALGRHEDHQIEGLKHLRDTPLAPYAFACVSHFTKGAPPDELVAAGLPRAEVEAFARAIDVLDLTWEERCAALADSCMKGAAPVPTEERFADLRRRYGPGPLIDLQERRTAALRAEIAAEIARDPLSAVGLA